MEILKQIQRFQSLPINVGYYKDYVMPTREEYLQLVKMNQEKVTFDNDIFKSMYSEVFQQLSVDLQMEIKSTLMNALRKTEIEDLGYFLINSMDVNLFNYRAMLEIHDKLHSSKWTQKEVSYVLNYLNLQPPQINLARVLESIEVLYVLKEFS